MGKNKTPNDENAQKKKRVKEKTVETNVSVRKQNAAN